MPTSDGRFLGQGWSRRKELSWERIFVPKGEHKFAHPRRVSPATEAQKVAFRSPPPKP